MGSVHFVESVALDTPEEVFQAIGRRIRCAAIPHRDLAIQLRPLEQLRLAPTTELYLGLVHVKDGVSGSAARAAAAKRHRRHFGIASECGISRGRDPNLALDFIEVHAKTAAAL